MSKTWKVHNYDDERSWEEGEDGKRTRRITNKQEGHEKEMPIAPSIHIERSIYGTRILSPQLYLNANSGGRKIESSVEGRELGADVTNHLIFSTYVRQKKVEVLLPELQIIHLSLMSSCFSWPKVDAFRLGRHPL